MAASDVPRLRYQDIQSRAVDFLGKYHPDLDLPVPIERIAELKLGLDIVPVTGFHEACGVDAFTTTDMTEIHVDEYMQAQRETRYRFTLAHEIGHIVLHREYYKKHRWTSIDEWKRAMDEIDNEAWRWMEWHANVFAALVLMPDELFPDDVQSCEEMIALHDCDLRKRNPSAYEDFLAECLAQKFQVSPDAAGHHLRDWRKCGPFRKGQRKG
jgi:Zn-dependent peptidase ImmA (M78 family)